MLNNYKTIQHQLRKYSFEFLKVNPEPLNMLEKLNKNYPRMIEDAQKHLDVIGWWLELDD